MINAKKILPRILGRFKYLYLWKAKYWSKDTYSFVTPNFAQYT